MTKFWEDWEDFCTGGGCMAKRKLLDKHHEALVTEEEGCSIPNPNDDRIMLGIYNSDGDQLLVINMKNDVEEVWYE